MHSVDNQVLIVGAGPYGVSLAYELHLAGVPFVLAGRPFSTWFEHTMAGADLRSDVNSSELFARDDAFDLRRFLVRRYGRGAGRDLARRRMPVPVFRDYLRWAIGRLPFSATGSLVRSLARTESGFVAQLDDGTRLRTSRVVLASGIGPHQALPACLAELPAARVVHAWDVARFDGLVGRRLLVVGGGQSAAEAVKHLAPQNQITWVHRSPLVFFSEPINLPRAVFHLVLRASGAFRLVPEWLRRVLGRKFVAATITPDLRAQAFREDVTRVRADVADLALEAVNGHLRSMTLRRDFDEVIACTGYHYSLATLPYLDPALQGSIVTLATGAPRLGPAFETSVDGLFLVGGLAEPCHGPGQRFMFGCRHATLAVSIALQRA